MPIATVVGPGECLSECSLWVHGWKHRGNSADEAEVLLALRNEKLA